MLTIAIVIVCPKQFTAAIATELRALRKGQSSVFNITRDIRGGARTIEHAFSLGVSTMAEAAQFVGERLQHEAVW